MPIKVPDSLPAIATLESENIFVMSQNRAIHQDIRPLHILILNLMPTKIETETQLLRLLSNSSLQIEIDLLHMASHTSKNTPMQHFLDFYYEFDDIKDKKYDGMIITGAPVEQMPFEDVNYWPELCKIMEWSKSHVFSTLHICWGSQAGLYYHYGIQKHEIGRKLSGIYKHRILELNHPLLRGFDEVFMAPHSRYTGILREDIVKVPNLKIIAESNKAGVYIVISRDGRHVFVSGHSEYDRDTLAKEYFRDVNRGLDPDIPCNYFPDDDPTKIPLYTWRAHANLLFSNWLNYYVYQLTPYDLSDISH